MKLLELQEQANQIIKQVSEVVKSKTIDNPLILFKKDDPFLDEKIYDLPTGYFVGRHSEYMQGAIHTVKGNDVTLFLTGDEYGDTIEIELYQLPVESLIELLTYLSERE